MKLNKNTVPEILSWILISYWALVVILSFSGNIAFGHGLGDLFYTFFILFMLILQIALTLSMGTMSSVKNKKYLLITIVAVFSIIALKITYDFTLGRGPEHSWDGNIFTS